MKFVFNILGAVALTVAVSFSPKAHALGRMRVIDTTHHYSPYKRIVHPSCKVFFGYPFLHLIANDEPKLEASLINKLREKGYVVIAPGNHVLEDLIIDGKVDGHLVLVGETEKFSPDQFRTRHKDEYGCSVDLKFAQWSGRDLRMITDSLEKQYTTLSGYIASDTRLDTEDHDVCAEQALKIVDLIPQCIEAANEFEAESDKSKLPECSISYIGTYAIESFSIYAGPTSIARYSEEDVLTIPNLPHLYGWEGVVASNLVKQAYARSERDKFRSKGICR